MIEKHQQTNGIGRGKITINPEYIKRAREITVGGQPIKVLSSNPNTGRVLAQFPDGHTEEVKAAPDYFIGGNTSTKELKNNQPIYGETNTAANERADSQDEAHDLTPIFSNLITAGQISTMNEGAQDLQNGKYLEGTTKLLSPAMFGSGIGGIAARSGIGGYNLFNKNGVRKTYNLFNQGNYGEGALSLLGDAFNAAMATEGLGSISNTLKGTSGYRNWRLAREINQAIKNNKPNIEVPNSTKYNISDNITLYRANPTNIKNPSYKGERYGDTSGQYVGKWFTDESSKPNWYASNMAKGGEEPAYYQVTVPRYWAEQQKASKQISNPRIEFEPEDYIIDDGIQGLQGQLYQGRPGTIQYLQQNFKPTKLLEPSTSLKFFERPQSKISEAERLGVPKGERNQPLNTGYHGEIQKIIGQNNIATMGENSTYLRRQGIQYLGDTYEKPTGELYTLEDSFGKTLRERTKTIESFSPEDEYLPERYEVNKNGLKKLKKPLNINLFSKKLPKEVYDYLEQIKTIIPNKAFLNQTNKLIPISSTENIPSSQITPFIVKQWKGKMQKLGYHVDDISDYQIAQLLTDQYNTLTKQMIGKTKGSIFWHGTPEDYRDFFDFKHTGENTGNMGAMGPGNYFSTGYSYYGDYAEPFLINNITQTPFGNAIAVEKGLIPKYIPTGNPGFAKQVAEYLKNPNLTGYSEQVKSYADYIRKLLKNIPNEKTRMWIGDGGNRPELTTEGFIPKEVMIRRNTGIKSLFPHPDLFVRDNSGKVILDRNWNDIRVNYKQGGKMNILEFLKNGSGIHIKPSQKGSFTKYCNGKVTSECIQKGKNSPDPKIRKKATFADNARHFKHKDGGKAFVNGVNVLDSNPKMYKYNKKYKMAQEGAKLTFWQQAGNWIKDNQDSISTIGNGISNLISAKNRQDEINQFAQAKQKELKAFKYKTWKDKYLSNLQNQTDRSDIVNAHNAFNQTNINDALQEKQDEINNQIANLQYLNDQQDTGLGDITSGLLGIATNVLQGTTQKKKIYNTFNPLANQTMSQIRGKLLDINANFSE